MNLSKEEIEYLKWLHGSEKDDYLRSKLKCFLEKWNMSIYIARKTDEEKTPYIHIQAEPIKHCDIWLNFEELHSRDI